MYKVIKAEYLNIRTPRVINFPQRDKQNKTDVEKGNSVETEVTAQQILSDARRKADEIISQARSQADKLMEDAHKKINELQRNAEKEGYKTGFQSGQAVWEEAQEQLRREIDSQKKSLVEERNRILKQLEPEIIQLAIAIARSIIHAELYLAPDQINSIARAVLDRAQGEGKYTLKVPSEDYNEITSSLIENDDMASISVEVKCDNSIKRGCVAETPFGEVDGTIDGQLQEVIYDLQEVSRND